MPYDAEIGDAETAFNYHLGYSPLERDDVVKIKVRDLVASIRKNGFKKTVDKFYRVNTVSKRIEVDSACALGQAAINLQADPYKMSMVLGEIVRKEDSTGVLISNILADAITTLNDGSNATMEEIADMVEKNFDLDDEFYIVKNHFWDRFENVSNESIV